MNAWDAQPAILWLSTERWHAAEPKPVKRTARRHASTGAPVYGSGACGGDLPPCWVMNRESRGNIHAYNPVGCGGDGCYGKWQCDPDSCDGTGTEAEQDAEAARLWNGGAGCANWNAC